MTRLVSVCCAIALGLSLSACKDREACEQSRLEMAKTWKKVQDNAATRAAQPDEGLTEQQKDEHRKLWGEIEERAHLVQGSFTTEQVTWPAAEKGRAELKQAFQTKITNKDDPLVTGFGRLLDEADGKFDAFRDKCR